MATAVAAPHRRNTRVFGHAADAGTVVVRLSSTPAPRLTSIVAAPPLAASVRSSLGDDRTRREGFEGREPHRVSNLTLRHSSIVRRVGIRSLSQGTLPARIVRLPRATPCVPARKMPARQSPRTSSRKISGIARRPTRVDEDGELCGSSRAPCRGLRGVFVGKSNFGWTASPKS